jgi:hypothetical protein
MFQGYNAYYMAAPAAGLGIRALTDEQAALKATIESLAKLLDDRAQVVELLFGEWPELRDRVKANGTLCELAVKAGVKFSILYYASGAYDLEIDTIGNQLLRKLLGDKWHHIPYISDERSIYQMVMSPLFCATVASLIGWTQKEVNMELQQLQSCISTLAQPGHFRAAEDRLETIQLWIMRRWTTLVERMERLTRLRVIPQVPQQEAQQLRPWSAADTSQLRKWLYHVARAIERHNQVR